MKGNGISYFTGIVGCFLVWHFSSVESCYYGRYGKYENWPSIQDWEELFLLLFGKHWVGGGHGWGWGSGNPGGNPSVSYIDGYSGGGGGYGSSHSGYNKGSSYFSSPASQNAYSSTLGSGSSAAEKMKKALQDYFAKAGIKPKFPSYDSSGLGVGQVFKDTPGYGAPGPNSYRDEQLSYGPPYETDSYANPGNSWPGSGSPAGAGLPTKPRRPPKTPKPSYDTGPSNDYGPPYNDHLDHHEPSYGPPPTNHYDNDPPRNPYAFDPPKDEYSPSGPQKGQSHYNTNQFQSDYDTFGYDDKKKRRNGKRRWYQSQASPTKPKQPRNKPPRRRPSKPGRWHRRLQDRLLRIARRKIDTSFGGYKVDHKKLRYG